MRQKIPTSRASPGISLWTRILYRGTQNSVCYAGLPVKSRARRHPLARGSPFSTFRCFPSEIIFSICGTINARQEHRVPNVTRACSGGSLRWEILRRRGTRSLPSFVSERRNGIIRRIFRGLFWGKFRALRSEMF